MAAAPRFHEAVEISQQQKLLGVGCHVVLLDGNPVADPATIPTMLDSASQRGSGPRFRATLGIGLHGAGGGLLSQDDVNVAGLSGRFHIAWLL